MVALTNKTQTMLSFSRIFKFNVFEFNSYIKWILLTGALRVIRIFNIKIINEKTEIFLKVVFVLL